MVQCAANTACSVCRHRNSIPVVHQEAVFYLVRGLQGLWAPCLSFLPPCLSYVTCINHHGHFWDACFLSVKWWSVFLLSKIHPGSQDHRMIEAGASLWLCPVLGEAACSKEKQRPWDTGSLVILTSGCYRQDAQRFQGQVSWECHLRQSGFTSKPSRYGKQDSSLSLISPKCQDKELQIWHH